jgi:hypothetical protein
VLRIGHERVVSSVMNTPDLSEVLVNAGQAIEAITKIVNNRSIFESSPYACRRRLSACWSDSGETGLIEVRFEGGFPPRLKAAHPRPRLHGIVWKQAYASAADQLTNHYNCVLPWLPKPGGAETLLGEVGQCFAPQQYLYLGETKWGLKSLMLLFTITFFLNQTNNCFHH